jgi:glutamate-ammonia-ligase adenylyltransferase
MTSSPPSVTARDLFLSRDLTEEQARAYLASRGFQDPVAADEHLQAMAADLPTRQALGAVADTLLDALSASADPDGALVGFTRYLATRTPKRSFLGYLRDDPRAAQILTQLLGASPSLGEILIRNPEYFHWLQLALKRTPPDHIDYHAELDSLAETGTDMAARLDGIKRFRRREYLGVAARDLLGVTDMADATRQLSTLADVVIHAVLRLLGEDLRVTSGRSAVPGRFAVIGMGKLGGMELNYSSDIDLVYVYDPTDPEAPADHEFFHKLARRLTKALGDHTDESYLYRVDLRLRPMGRHGDVACGLKQYEHYYETMGETFERFALIKARPVAGDKELGQSFIDAVRPFIYRKYLDHAALDEIARYKRRAEQASDGDRNVKVGRGGIREIELFTQVLQVTYGAEHQSVRSPTTLIALAALRDEGIIDTTVHGELDDAYRFLRMVEHRLQIVHQSQTHSLDGAPEVLDVSARRMGFDSSAALESTLSAHRDRVHAVYADLLTPTEEDVDDGRRLFRLLGGELTDDEATEYLGEYGFTDPSEVLHLIRTLDQVPSLVQTRSTTRNLLANLLAEMLVQVAATAEPSRVLNRLERIVTRSGAPGSLYRSLLETPQLRTQMVRLLDTGDLLADRLSRFPELLDFLVAAPPDTETHLAAWKRELDDIGTIDPPARADRIRRLRQIEEAKVLVEWMADGDLTTLQEKLSGLADACVGRILGWLRQETQISDTQIEWVVVALGKLGGGELTVHSDLDLVFVYRGERGDGALFSRCEALVRNLYRFLEAPTSEGIAYHLDTRLRPNGKKGALALPFDKFAEYMTERAERWERLAWTRYRVVTGSPALTEDMNHLVTGFVYGDWDPSLPAYARHIRSRMETELGKEQRGNRFDLKVGRGGLADIDFLLQLLQIHHGATHTAWRVAGSRRLLATSLPSPVLDADETVRLRDAHLFLRTLETHLRIESEAGASVLSTDPETQSVLGSRMGLPAPSGDALRQRYAEVTGDVRAIFDKGIERLNGTGIIESRDTTD